MVNVQNFIEHRMCRKSLIFENKYFNHQVPKVTQRTVWGFSYDQFRQFFTITYKVLYWFWRNNTWFHLIYILSCKLNSTDYVRIRILGLLGVNSWIICLWIISADICFASITFSIESCIAVPSNITNTIMSTVQIFVMWIECVPMFVEGFVILALIIEQRITILDSNLWVHLNSSRPLFRIDAFRVWIELHCRDFKYHEYSYVPVLIFSFAWITCFYYVFVATTV